MKPFRVATYALAALALGSGAALAQKKPTKRPVVPTKPPVAGQNQQKGGPGVFGETYSLKAPFNMTLVSAAYSLAPDPCLGGVSHEQKAVLLHWRMKNRDASEHDILDSALPVTMVDTNGKSYDGDGSNLMWRETDRVRLLMFFKPGQGIEDIYSTFRVPTDARISKIIINTGRLGSDEQVIRYFIAGAAKKDPDGADGDPKNVITPLPMGQASPKDPSGATALKNIPAKVGDTVPMNVAYMTVEGFSFADKIGDREADANQRFLIVTLTYKNALSHDALVTGETGSRGGMEATTVDTDGEESKPERLNLWWKATRDEPVDDTKTLPLDGTYKMRAAFIVPKGRTFKTITLNFLEPTTHGFTFDISGVK